MALEQGADILVASPGDRSEGMINGHQLEAVGSVVQSVDLAVSCRVLVVGLDKSLTSPSCGFLVCKMETT